MGIPSDLIKLIREWLAGRTFYVQVSEDVSALFIGHDATINKGCTNKVISYGAGAGI